MADRLAGEDRGRVSGSLRAHAARGTLINGGFLVGLTGLGLVKGILIAALMSTTQYGVWGILLAALGLVLWLRQLGIADRYIQQSESDQGEAFRRAFGIELMVHLACFVLMVLAIPLITVAYGYDELLAPGLVLALVIPASALQFPLRTFQRQLRWGVQRTLQAFEPVVGFAVTIGLIAAGWGVWGLVLGALAGGWSAAIAALIASPYGIRPVFERRAVRDYLSFSWPILIYTGSAVVMGQMIYLTGARTVGLEGVAAIGLTSMIASLTDRLDTVLTQTLYPVICAVRDRRDLLLESFVKSNRLTLMWGVPFGVGLTLFAPDLVQFVIGDKWDHATGLLMAFGLIAALHHVGFNWDAFFRARGETRPLAIAGVFAIVSTLVMTVPLMIAFGLTGYAIGMAAGQVLYTWLRGHLLRRLFPGFDMLRHAARSLAPVVPAAAAVVAARLVSHGDRVIWHALTEVALYGAITLLATLVLERRLLGEVLGYVRRRAAGRAVAQDAAAVA